MFYKFLNLNSRSELEVMQTGKTEVKTHQHVAETMLRNKITVVKPATLLKWVGMFIVRDFQKCAKPLWLLLQHFVEIRILLCNDTFDGRALKVNQKCAYDGFKINRKSIHNRS